MIYNEIVKICVNKPFGGIIQTRHDTGWQWEFNHDSTQFV